MSIGQRAAAGLGGFIAVWATYLLLYFVGGSRLLAADPSGTLLMAMSILIVAGACAIRRGWRPFVSGAVGVMVGVAAWFTALFGLGALSGEDLSVVWLMLATAMLGLAYLFVFRPLGQEETQRQAERARIANERAHEEHIEMIVRAEIQRALANERSET